MAIYNKENILYHPSVSVTAFGAKGDGNTNDASAIQDAIDELRTSGGTIVFPEGIYKVNSSIVFYSNQVLYFERGATLKQGVNTFDNLLRTYCDSTISGYGGVHDCAIIGGIFDGSNVTTNTTLICTVHAKNIVFIDCTFKNAYGTWHDLEINSSYNVKVIRCDFEGSRKTGVNGEMLQIDGAGSATYYPWDNINIDNTVSKYIEVSNCIFHDSSLVPAIGNHSNMAHKFVRIHDCIFDGITSSRGAINFVSNMTDIDIYDNTFNGCTTGIGSSGTTYYIFGNRFVSVTTAISGEGSIAHANMINGTYVA